MGYIKEPYGVDFFIKSRPLTDKDRRAISEFIRTDKAKYSTNNVRAKYAFA
ncbi:MAG: hypothetical protein LBN95_09095 [Prevotellaceae bacterium]|jgi:hypothetical protein|nr:hypothetical protein [Prevotellaceae bacterium]